MKLQYSLRCFLVSSSLLGLMAVFLTKYLLTEPPIAIKTVVYGHTSTRPPQAIGLSLLGVQRAVGRDRRNGDVSFTGRIVEVVSERVETSTKPPRFMPLLWGYTDTRSAISLYRGSCTTRWCNRGTGFFCYQAMV